MLTWDWAAIALVTVLFAMVRGPQKLGGNIIGSFILAVIFYLIVKIPILAALSGEIPSGNLQHHIIAGIASAVICLAFALFAVMRSRNPSMPPLHKLFSKNGGTSCSESK